MTAPRRSRDATAQRLPGPFDIGRTQRKAAAVAPPGRREPLTAWITTSKGARGRQQACSGIGPLRDPQPPPGAADRDSPWVPRCPQRRADSAPPRPPDEPARALAHQNVHGGVMAVPEQNGRTLRPGRAFGMTDRSRPRPPDQDRSGADPATVEVNKKCPGPAFGQGRHDKSATLRERCAHASPNVRTPRPGTSMLPIPRISPARRATAEPLVRHAAGRAPRRGPAGQHKKGPAPARQGQRQCAERQVWHRPRGPMDSAAAPRRAGRRAARAPEKRTKKGRKH